MKIGWAILFGVLCGLLAAGVILVTGSSPRGQAVELLPPPTPPPVVVHITGAVAQPGVYALPQNCRFQEAVQAAGGFLPEADSTSINLAALLQDGARLWIPFQTREESPTSSQSHPASPAVAGGTGSNPQNQPDLIDLNSASQSELETLPGIGPVIAQRIIAFREENGPFARIEDIENVSGIGPATFEKIKESITVGYGP